MQRGLKLFDWQLYSIVSCIINILPLGIVAMAKARGQAVVQLTNQTPLISSLQPITLHLGPRVLPFFSARSKISRTNEFQVDLI